MSEKEEMSFEETLKKELEDPNNGVFFEYLGEWVDKHEDSFEGFILTRELAYFSSWLEENHYIIVKQDEPKGKSQGG